MNALTQNDSIFVIHGRNTVITKSMFGFLRAIGLSPIDYGQAIALTRKPAPLVGDVLDAALEKAQVLLVLLTGDDLAYLHPAFCNDDDPPEERQLLPQARANVLFQAGMALSRRPDKTVLVQVGNIRPISDLAGRLLHLTNIPESRHQLAQRLKTAGCPVDLSGSDWSTVGTFEVSIPAPLPNFSQEVGFRLSTNYLAIFAFVMSVHRHFVSLHAQFISPLSKQLASAGAHDPDPSILENCDELWINYRMYYRANWPLAVATRLVHLADINGAFRSLLSDDSIRPAAKQSVANAEMFFHSFIESVDAFSRAQGPIEQSPIGSGLPLVHQGNAALAQYSAQLTTLSRTSRAAILHGNNVMYNLINAILSL